MLSTWIDNYTLVGIQPVYSILGLSKTYIYIDKDRNRFDITIPAPRERIVRKTRNGHSVHNRGKK